MSKKGPRKLFVPELSAALLSFKTFCDKFDDTKKEIDKFYRDISDFVTFSRPEVYTA